MKKKEQSVKHNKDKASSFLAASLPSTEKHDFAAVITANNLPEDLQILISPHIQDLNADLVAFEQRIFGMPGL